MSSLQKEADMQTKFIIAATLTMVATSAMASSNEVPYALSAEHADFQAQLEQVSEIPGDVGIAASVAAGLMARHSLAQERVVLQRLGSTDWATTEQPQTDAELRGQTQSLEVELTKLFDGDVELVTALVGLYAAAEEVGQSEISRLAERVIWHETRDVEVLYPAALLASSVGKAE